MPSLTAARPLSLYVHLPWCEKKCPYCDFNSYAARGAVSEDAYVDALLRDFEFEVSRIPGNERPALTSIFIGGGTPSLFSPRAVRRLLSGLLAGTASPAPPEITLEANPGTAEARRFEGFLAAGVTRLSVGVQSFRDDKLQSLGRIHDAAEARRAIALATDAGFANVNVDLMYGLPDDDAEGAIRDLESALATEATHISWYQLTLEPHTAFHRRPPPLPDDDTVIRIEDAGRESLARSGYDRYEVSAYARDGLRCRHNLNYWTFGDYIGIGAGAHGKLTCADGRSFERRARTRKPATYIAAAGTADAVTAQRIDDDDAIVVEFMMNALRLVTGVSVRHFEETTGLPADRIAAGRNEAEARGWLDSDPGVLRATPAGLGLLNRLLSLF